MDSLVNQGPSVIHYRKQEINQAPALAGLLSFVEQSDYDDMDALKIDYRAIPRWRIGTKSNECLRHKCPSLDEAALSMAPASKPSDAMSW